jgi:hypothetical protein
VRRYPYGAVDDCLLLRPSREAFQLAERLTRRAPPALRPDPFSLCCGRAALEGKAEPNSVSSTGPSALVVAWRPVRIGDRVALRCLARELRFQLMLREELDVAMPWSDLRLVPRCPSGHGKGSDQGGDKGKLGDWSHLASFGVVAAQACADQGNFGKAAEQHPTNFFGGQQSSAWIQVRKPVHPHGNRFGFLA